MGLITQHPTVTIAAGASLSSPASVGSKVLCGIIFPAVWTSASLTFQVSVDGGATWLEYYDDSTTEQQILTTTPTGLYLALDASMFAGVTMLKVRSGTFAAPVNQVAAASLMLVARKFYAIH
jgi:hypothetical protein